MKNFEEFLKESDFSGKISGLFVAYRLKTNIRLNKEWDVLSMNRKITNDSGWKKGTVSMKGKTYQAGLKQWVKDTNPEEYWLMTKVASSSHKDDVVDIYYKK